jgi:peptide chain release factor subunit 1
VELVIVTDDISVVVVEANCWKCANRDIDIVERPRLLMARQELLSSSCKNCGNPDQETRERDIVEYFEELCSSTGAGLEIISGKSEEGAQVSSLGKVGAILRFRPTVN